MATKTMARRAAPVLTTPSFSLIRRAHSPLYHRLSNTTAAFSVAQRSLATTNEAHAAVLQDQEQQQQQQQRATSLYSFHDVSERDTLLSEMRHHHVSWTTISDHFGISLADAFMTYIGAASKAYTHGWSPRMTAQDIEHYLTRRK
ncbi:hypothetical protein BC939DRAFT_499502 [Gamsiella multidivaricata]|uniref:uncharacterized protein n=1 Tax=Gamsiella multidivaricata TaxID=101098 RepID=UPI002220FAF8|nr:uncharacterized protein BC939DRAFT_499502 [Gamsiella multidivaricata]KAI7830367.1 hypothetical protein BC939DRAFT_499502 [Gamsiella multidivaricata]